MSIRMLARVIAAAALAFAVTAQAQDEQQEQPQGWSGTGELGWVSTSGNSDTQTLNAKLALQLDRNAWTYKGGLNVLRASEDGDKTAERYEATAKTKYHFDEKSYWFNAFRYEDDRFSGFDYQTTLTTGYGRTLLESDTQKLDTEIGVGARRSKPSATEMMPMPESSTDAVLRGGAEYAWQLTDTTKFTNDFLVESGQDNTYAENQAGLSVAINSRFSVKLGYAVRHNSKVPSGTDKTDTVTTVNLVYTLH